MQFWIIQTLNSVAFGGLLFLLSSGFSLIFGLMRIPNLAHGAFFMLGAYFGYSLLALKFNFWIAAIGAGLGVGLVGIILERFVLRQLPGNAQGQVLVRARRSTDEGPGAVIVTGHGLSTNIIEASLEAYLVAANKLHAAEVDGVAVASVGGRIAEDLP